MYSTLTRDFVGLTLRFLRNLFLFYVSPLLNSPLSRGELTAGFVSNSHYPSSLQVRTVRFHRPGTAARKPLSSVHREVGPRCRSLKIGDLHFRNSCSSGNDIVGYAIFLEFFGDPDLFFITAFRSTFRSTFCPTFCPTFC